MGRGVVRFETVTIANGAAVSSAFPFNGQRVVGVIAPAAWTTANISFEVEYPAGTWVKVIDQSGSLYVIAGVATALSEMRLMHSFSTTTPQTHPTITGFGAGRVVSTNTGSETDVNQGAERTLVVVLADI